MRPPSPRGIRWSVWCRSGRCGSAGSARAVELVTRFLDRKNGCIGPGESLLAVLMLCHDSMLQLQHRGAAGPGSRPQTRPQTLHASAISRCPGLPGSNRMYRCSASRGGADTQQHQLVRCVSVLVMSTRPGECTTELLTRSRSCKTMQDNACVDAVRWPARVMSSDRTGAHKARHACASD